MRFERRPEKTCHKKPLWGKKCAGNLGRNHGSSFKRFEAHPTKALQNEIITADPTGLGAWYLKKKELNKEKKQKKN